MQIREKVAAFSLIYIGGSLRSCKSSKYEVISKSNLFFIFCHMNKPFEFWMRQDHSKICRKQNFDFNTSSFLKKIFSGLYEHFYKEFLTKISF
eukprot:UN23363